MNRLVLLVGLVACDAGLPAPAPTAPPSPRPPASLPAPVVLASPFLSANGHQYAIVRVHGFVSEPCTNMGGMDWSFTVEGMPADYRLRGGGHGIYGEGSTLPGFLEQTEGNTTWRERYYVAEVALAPHGSVERHILCVDDHAKFDGIVLAVAPARDLADARAQLAAAPTRGLRGAVRIDRMGP